MAIVISDGHFLLQGNLEHTHTQILIDLCKISFSRMNKKGAVSALFIHG
jgi:hypothetical protein